MKVDKQTIELNKQRIEDLNQKQKNYIKSREKELEGIKSVHKNKIEDIKLNNEMDLIDIRSQNEQRLIEENENQQQSLARLKENQDQLKTMLQKERDLLDLGSKEQLKNIKAQYQQRVADAHYKGRAQEVEVNNDINEKIKDFQTERNAGLIKIQNKNTNALLEAEARQNRQINDIQNKLDRELLDKKQEYTKQIIDQKSVHNKKIDKVTNDNTREIEQRQLAHSFNIQDQQKRHSEHLKSEKEAFTQKYAELVKNQQNAIDSLTKKLNEQSAAMKESHSKDLSLNQNLLEDPFYQITKLNPKVEEKPDSYIISIETPEHEKDKFTISVNKRKIRFNLARRFEDRLENIEGQKDSVFTGHRTESYTKEFFVDQILDSRKITHKWEDGQLYFKIKKA